MEHGNSNSKSQYFQEKLNVKGGSVEIVSDHEIPIQDVHFHRLDKDKLTGI